MMVGPLLRRGPVSVPLLRSVFMLVLISVAGPGTADEPHPVTARLVAAQGDDGRRWVGVELTMADGWHVYWRHPGEAGLATAVELELPPGAEAGELGWPVPERFESPGGITSYGYGHRVVLAAPVRGAGEGGLAADVSWLACRDVCILGEARVAGPATSFGLAPWLESLPTGDAPFELRVTGGLGPGQRSATPTVWLQWPGTAPDELVFAPDPGDGLRVENVRVRSRGSLVRIDLEATRLGAGSLELPAVVAVGGPDDHRKGYRLTVPLEDTKGDGT